MTDPIRAALERLIKDTEYLAKGGEDLDRAWAAIATARAALASDGPAVPKSREPASVVGESIDDAELDELFTEIDQSGEALSWRAYARAVLARWGHQPAPLVAGAPGPSMEDVGPLIAWLTEQACQAADASQPADAGMLTWAAQVIGERVNEDAPVAGEVEGLVKELQMMASHAAATCQFTDAENLSRTAELLQQQEAEIQRLRAQQTPVPVSEEPWKRKGWCDERGRCWLQGKVEGDWRLLDPVNSGVPQLKYCFNRSLPAHALPLPQGVE